MEDFGLSVVKDNTEEAFRASLVPSMALHACRDPAPAQSEIWCAMSRRCGGGLGPGSDEA